MSVVKTGRGRHTFTDRYGDHLQVQRGLITGPEQEGTDLGVVFLTATEADDLGTPKRGVEIALSFTDARKLRKILGKVLR